MKFSHLIIIFAAISISGCTVDSLQEKTIPKSALDLYGSEHKVTLYSKTNPQGKAASAFNNFKKGGREGKGYYGAFAYSVGSGRAYGAHTGYNTLKIARESALAGCSSYRKKGGAPCEIIATLTPRGYVNKQKMTFSKNATNALRKQENQTKYRAFAINDAGYFYRGSEYETQKYANLDVLEGCNLHAKSKTPRHQKLYPCYLVSEEL